MHFNANLFKLSSFTVTQTEHWTINQKQKNVEVWSLTKSLTNTMNLIVWFWFQPINTKTLLYFKLKQETLQLSQQLYFSIV